MMPRSNPLTIIIGNETHQVSHFIAKLVTVAMTHATIHILLVVDAVAVNQDTVPTNGRA